MGGLTGAMLVGAAALSLAAVGCGYRAPSTGDDVRATATTFIGTCAKGRPERAIELLTEPLRRPFIQSGPLACARFLGVAARGATVEGITLKGATAQVRLAGAGGRRSTLGLALVEGEWLIDSPPRGS